MSESWVAGAPAWQKTTQFNPAAAEYADAAHP
jgi:hypothetical protein